MAIFIVIQVKKEKVFLYIQVLDCSNLIFLCIYILYLAKLKFDKYFKDSFYLYRLGSQLLLQHLCCFEYDIYFFPKSPYNIITQSCVSSMCQNKIRHKRTKK